MKTRIEILEIPGCVYKNYSAGNRIIVEHSLHQLLTQDVLCAQLQTGQQTPIKYEKYTQNFRT